ncbi:MAG: adenylosuccinate synthase [Dehalococcoidia bacterium]|nr:adenylosuccinate synthase [Dehalococcoidia bacterium]
MLKGLDVMSVVVVVGIQWGDEGKGRVVDLLADKADVVARFSGGSNAGHTVINDLGEFRLAGVPSGIFNPRCLSVIGNGCVVNPRHLCEELDGLIARGIPVDNLRISDRAHVIMPYHLLLDYLEEQARGEDAIGTTGNGIGPAYVDKTAREGIRMADFIQPAVFRRRLATVLSKKNPVLVNVYHHPPIDPDQLAEEYHVFAERLAPYVTETGELIRRALRDGKRVLLEGAQAAMLDLDFGTYPYVTSSHPVAAGACLGVGIGPTAVDEVVGVVKAYSTRVGAGPMPTELLDETGDRIRDIGKEYGTRTGRARRTGWFDAVVGRYGADVNGVTRLAVTRLDILDTFPELKICVAYELDGERITHIPTDLADLARCRPIYETLPGWMTSTSLCRTFDDLPANAKAYVDLISQLLGAPVELVGVGARRMQAILHGDLFN